MKPYVMVVNPTAGRGKGASMAGSIEKKLTQQGISCHRRDTSQPGEAEEITKNLLPSTYGRILVVGGDGTLNEVLRGLQQPAPPLAIFPAGTGNDVARMLGIRNETHALETAIHGVARKIDLGVASGQPFTNIFSFGLDAAIATQANQWKKLLPGWLLYPAALVKTVFTFRPPRVKVEIQTREGMKTREPEDILLMAVCNGGYYGGGMNINPQANLFDGELELCIVRPMPLWKILAFFPTVYKGTHLQFKEVTLEKVTQVTFTASTTMLMNRDGETWPDHQGSISLVPEGITVMCPE